VHIEQALVSFAVAQYLFIDFAKIMLQPTME
jgi:hypothetical protein